MSQPIRVMKDKLKEYETKEEIIRKLNKVFNKTFYNIKIQKYHIDDKLVFMDNISKYLKENKDVAEKCGISEEMFDKKNNYIETNNIIRLECFYMLLFGLIPIDSNLVNKNEVIEDHQLYIRVLGKELLMEALENCRMDRLMVTVQFEL